MKPKIGKEAYSVKTIIELTKKKEVNFDINAHDQEIVIPDLKTNFIWVYNGKYGGGDMLLSPFSLVNDGACELTYFDGRVGFCQSIPFFNKVKAGGE